MRPDQGIVVAVRTFEAALQDYRHDSVALEPLLAQYGSRPLGSFGVAAAERPALRQDVGTLVQKLREARYAARHLQGHLGTLRASLPKSLFERIFSAPIEDASEILGSASAADPRSKAAGELRQLRDLFASTGFGDLLKAPEDLARQIEDSKEAADGGIPPASPSYSPQILDLLLELSTLSEYQAQAEWPSSVRRARTVQEALDEVAGGRFDVVVIDDAPDFSAVDFRQIGASPTVHRLGGAEREDAIQLEIPHRQADADVAAAASGQPSRWLGAPDSFGLLVRADPEMSLEQLSAAACLLVAELIRSGCSASLVSGTQTADVIVAAMDELHEAGLAEVAQKAARGIVVLCRKDERPSLAQQPGLPAAVADAQSALALGWKVQRAAAEGTVLEKDGKVAALVNETAAMSPWDETVTDVSRRLEALGWQPIVAWNGAERGRAELDRLLTAHSLPSAPNPFRKVAEEFDLRAPPPQGGGPGPAGRRVT